MALKQKSILLSYNHFIHQAQEKLRAGRYENSNQNGATARKKICEKINCRRK